MQITEVAVSAGRTFNHPFENFSNFRPEVTVKARVQEGDDAEAAVRELQKKAETLVENHKNAILAHLHTLQNLSKTEDEINQLEARIAAAQTRLDQIRAGKQLLANNEADGIPF
jgi:predicted signal transduction protein with EAL and GGDEF domain